ncbi:MAG: TlpA family protein disulfide reductase [Pseudomonadaceae bacterium]|nr:TlpA family protein disulfide reductase [Pseudomonadaceae bacterium]
MSRRRRAGRGVLWLFAGLVLLAGCSEPSAIEERLKLSDGRVAPVEHWQDRYLVINYWAEWCKPCREEISELNTLHADRVSHDLVVLGVNYDGLVGAPLIDVMTRMDVKFPVLATDPSERWGFPVPKVLPTTYILDGQRNLLATLVGPQTEESLLRATQASTDL